MEQTHDLPGAWFQQQWGGRWWTKAGAHLAEGLGHGPKWGPKMRPPAWSNCITPLPQFFLSFNLVPVPVWSVLQLARCHCLCTTDTNRFWRVMWNYPELFKSHRPYLFSSATCIALTGVALFMHVCRFTLALGLCWPSVPGGNLWFHTLLKLQNSWTFWAGVCIWQNGQGHQLCKDSTGNH